MTLESHQEMFTHALLLLFSLPNLSSHLSLPARRSLKVSQRQGAHCPPHRLLLLQGVHLALPGNDHLSSICAAKLLVDVDHTETLAG